MSLAAVMSRLASMGTVVGSRAALLPRTPARQAHKATRNLKTSATRNKQEAQSSQVPVQQGQGQSQSAVSRAGQQQQSGALQRATPFGALSPFADFGAVAPSFGRVGGFLRSIEQEMDQMLQALATGNLEVAPPEFRDVLVPLQVDIQDKDKEIVITADTPGLTGADIAVIFDPETKILTISGDREVDYVEPGDDAASAEGATDEAPASGQGYTRIERKFGSFSRRFKLPDNVDADNITAKVNNGVLEIHIPKTEAETSKQQKINVEG